MVGMLSMCVCESDTYLQPIQIRESHGHVVDVVVRDVQLQQRGQHVHVVLREVHQLVVAQVQPHQLVQLAKIVRHQLHLVV